MVVVAATTALRLSGTSVDNLNYHSHLFSSRYSYVSFEAPNLLSTAIIFFLQLKFECFSIPFGLDEKIIQLPRYNYGLLYISGTLSNARDQTSIAQKVLRFLEIHIGWAFIFDPITVVIKRRCYIYCSRVHDYTLSVHK